MRTRDVFASLGKWRLLDARQSGGVYFFTQVSVTVWPPATLSSTVSVFPSAESVAVFVMES